MKPLSDRIAADRIECRAWKVGANPQVPTSWDWGVELSRPGDDGFPVRFGLVGLFTSADEPTAFDVLCQLTGACSVVDQCANREEWAAEYTTDPDEQDRLYTVTDFWTWQDINERLTRFLGHQGHEDYLYDTDRQT